MEQEATKTILAAYEDIRRLAEDRLPLGNSLLSCDILVTMLKGGEALTVKKLFASLPNSQTGIRYHFNKLLDDGWIEFRLKPGDRRVKYVFPTTKLLREAQGLIDDLRRLLCTKIEN